MIPFVQAIASFGVTDMSFSRIRNHCGLRAYGIFFEPILTQHRFNGGNDPEPAHRFPEYFVHHKAELDKRFPRPTQQTRLLAKSAPRFWLFANHPKADASALGIAPDDVLVNFLPDGDNGSYKWHKHDLQYEAEYYRKHEVPIRVLF